ncbi:MAG: polymer-forming cytoskeletal protein [Gammaproteobacteria bacterium]|jgi:cytoskeletal protein CcmA (bactofilin family)|nr:polymer-forming cytoskeletal protein [Gammaproteobacteria bacterium]
MWGNNQKRRATRIDTLIGQHSEVLGDIKFSGGLHIDGTIKGNVIAERDSHSMLSLSEQGTIEGEVNVPFVVLNGVVIGDVHGGDHVELASKARVTGNVYYNLIEMAIGAEVNGKLVHMQDAEDSPSMAIDHLNSLEATE